jgi:hypothetical protein
MDKSMLPSILALIATCITAIVSILVAFWNFFATRKNSEDLEKMKADILQSGKEKDARRDYEYEARKRLYKRCEPLLFQMRESSEAALSRIFSLARTAKQGKLNIDGEHWLLHNEYYLLSTIYNLIVPLAIYRLLRKELTLVDFNMDSSIRYRYELSKILYLLFTEDFALAKNEEKLDYDPFIKDWESKRNEHPEKHWRQGIVLGKLEKAVEAIIIKNDISNDYRWMHFGEFETSYHENKNDFQDCIQVFDDLFRNFNPSTRPVLWRLLVSQSYVYNLIIRASGDNPYFIDSFKPFEELSGFEVHKLDWLNDDSDVGFNWRESFKPSESYLKEKLKSIYSTHLLDS